jgi:hypothetical protein
LIDPGAVRRPLSVVGSERQSQWALESASLVELRDHEATETDTHLRCS